MYRHNYTYIKNNNRPTKEIFNFSIKHPNSLGESQKETDKNDEENVIAIRTHHSQCLIYCTL